MQDCSLLIAGWMVKGPVPHLLLQAFPGNLAGGRHFFNFKLEQIYCTN